ncbi:CMGC/SRPK protein kinase [Blastomyces dermatitidis ATCC 26199]|nr:CMGC/SRPK protein kinase [Blastomyces dermatitidis ATCC 26199]
MMFRYSKIIPSFIVPLKFSLPSLTPSPLSICRSLKSRFGMAACLSSSTTGADGNQKVRYYEYKCIYGVEHLEKYEPGGYHPLMIGDILHNRYKIVTKLGFGGFSTVWLALDTQKKQYVALKVGVADQDQPRHESEILHKLSNAALSSSRAHPGHRLIPAILDEFAVDGPNGRHPCYTTLPARCDLGDAAYGYVFPLQTVRALAAGITQALAYMHSRGFIHGDVHIRNILVKTSPKLDSLSIEDFYKQYGEPNLTPVEHRDGKSLPPNIPSMAVTPIYIGRITADQFTLTDARVMLSDFGEAFSPASHHRQAQDSHTPLGTRPPEARFEPCNPLSYAADIWSLGLLIWRILGLKSLFTTEFPCPDELVSQYIDVLRPGPDGIDMPESWWRQWDGRDKFFDNNREPIPNREIWPSLETGFDHQVQYWRRKDQMGEFGDDERRAILDLLRQMLKFIPAERATAEQVLESEWMVKWALPDFQRSYLDE